MRPNAAVLATASLLLLALTGCTAAEAGTAPPIPDATESPTPEASTPLTCDDLVPVDAVAAALVGADGASVEPVAAVNGTDAFTGVLLEGLGGLACSWRVGAGMPEYNPPSDWAYLRIDVLPDAADQWVPLSFGDGPGAPDLTEQIAGIEASVSGGDPGWSVSAPVGDDWVVASISAAGLTGAGSRFSGVGGGGVMIDRLADVAGVAFTALAQAAPGQLDRPTVDLRQSDAACTGVLDGQGIAAAMQLHADSTVEVTVDDPAASAPESFTGAVWGAARAFTCSVNIDGRHLTTITSANGFAPLFDRLRAPDGDVTFEPFGFSDVPAGVDAEAVVRRSDDGRTTLAFAAVGDTLYEIHGKENTEAVAQAIVARSR